MKEAFKKTMEIFFPEGVQDQQRLCDLARTFATAYFIGGATAYDRTVDAARIADDYSLFRHMTKGPWMPDDSWKWW
jgi:hypothetical protein